MVMWELLSNEIPFGNLQSPVRIMGIIVEGGRPPIPNGAPRPLVELVQQCWQLEPDRRPLFPAIVQRLEKMLESS
jgi:hypothetical protein